MEQISIILLAGLTNGSVYGLVGLSISLIYSTTRVINFAQGEFIMLGVMSTVMFMATLSLPMLPAIVGVLVVMILSALALELGVYRPLLRRGAPPLTIMIGMLAAAIIATGAALLVWGPLQLFVPNILPLDAMQVGPMITNAQQLGIILVFATLLFLTWILLYKTSFGLCVRATGVNARVASLMGIRSERMVRFGFVFSALISGVLGLLVGPLLGGQVAMGMTLTVKGFMAAILGGLGGPFAAAAGGVMIAIVEALVAGYGSSLYAEPIIFALILLILFFRPYGILGDFEAVRR